jgi:hypothetical protein
VHGFTPEFGAISPRTRKYLLTLPGDVISLTSGELKLARGGYCLAV